MGFFGKKKNTDTSSSVLSEGEIQKKLYGEFSGRVTSGVIVDREQLKESAAGPFRPKESSLQKEAAFDLFSAQKEALSERNLSSRQISPDPKSTDPASRYVPLQDFEKPPASSVATSAGSDSHARFRYNRPQENKGVAFMCLPKLFSEKTGNLFRFFLDPRQVALRRIFYWGVAILVVFLLFWGVNALNSQREDAMRVRYKIPGESVSVKASDVVTTVLPVNPVAERPVVITPAPVRPKKVRASEGGAVTASPASSSYVVQVVTYPTRQDADQVANTFRRAGLRAFVKENARPSGRLFYLVLLGGFRTEAEAQAQLLKFRAKEVARPFQDAFVRSSRS